MHLTRWIILSFFILAIMVVCTPQSRAAISQSWDQARPGVVEVMDHLYATIRNVVAGSDSQEGIEDNAPGVDFDLIITMERPDFL